MNEYTKGKVKVLVGVLVLLVCLALVLAGHAIGNFGDLVTGLKGLAVQLAGLAGILALLGVYNHSQQ